MVMMRMVDNVARIREKLGLFRCPRCKDETAGLQVHDGVRALECGACDTRYPIDRGVPLFARLAPDGGGRVPIGRWRSRCEIVLRTAIGTPLWLALLLWVALGERKRPPGPGKALVSEVERWLSCEFGGTPYNLYLKAVEAALFGSLGLERPALEIGGGGGDTSRIAFAGKRIDVDCEYYVDNIFYNARRGGDLYASTDLHIGGSVYDLPFRTAAFRTLVTVHVVDHLVDIDAALGEMARVLAPGGRLAFSTYAARVFAHLPLCRALRRFGPGLAERYLVWRRYRVPRWYGYGQLVADDPDNAAGQNLYTIEQWREVGLRHGLCLMEARPFTEGRFWTTFLDLQYRGDPRLLRRPLQQLISRLVDAELRGRVVLAEESAANLFLVFERP